MYDIVHKFCTSVAIINADKGVLTNPLAYDRVHKFCISLTISNADKGVIFKPLISEIRLFMPDPNYSAKRTHK